MKVYQYIIYNELGQESPIYSHGDYTESEMQVFIDEAKHFLAEKEKSETIKAIQENGTLNETEKRAVIAIEEKSASAYLEKGYYHTDDIAVTLAERNRDFFIMEPKLRIEV
jgi:hypothetical protein